MLNCNPRFKQAIHASARLVQTRHSSTINLSKLELALKARIFPEIYDYLSPQPSYLLDQSLKDFLAPGTFPAFRPPSSVRQPLPYGHHLVYFPTPTSASELLPDGTDTLHSPGPPFTQRLWAGGRVTFPLQKTPHLDGQRAVLLERIQDVHVTGAQGSEKVFVGIERRIGLWKEGEVEEKKRTFERATEPDVELGIVAERRDLCFLRDDASPFSRLSAPQKGLRPPTDPIFIFPLTPTPSLLFRFSALTFNAHAIHIDPEYTRNVYGLPKLLVHGPLCLTLMLECLSRALHGTGGKIKEITYRNFRPLFVGEQLRVCGKMKNGNEGQSRGSTVPDWEVWVETGEGENAALAVRGAASVTSPMAKELTGR